MSELRTSETYCVCGHAASNHREPAIRGWNQSTECRDEECPCGKFEPDFRPKSAEQYPPADHPQKRVDPVPSKERVCWACLATYVGPLGPSGKCPNCERSAPDPPLDVRGSKMMDLAREYMEARPSFVGYSAEGAIRHFAQWIDDGVPCKPTPSETCDDLTDKQRLDFIEAWLKLSKGQGLKWDTFALETDTPVREQIDQRILAGMAERLKQGGELKANESPLGRAVRVARGADGPPTEPVRFAAEETCERHGNKGCTHPFCIGY